MTFDLGALAFFIFVAIAAAWLHYRLQAENRPSGTYVRCLIAASLAGALGGFLIAVVICFMRWGNEQIDEEMQTENWICGIAAWLGGAFAVALIHWHAWRTTPSRVREQQLIAEDYKD